METEVEVDKLKKSLTDALTAYEHTKQSMQTYHGILLTLLERFDDYADGTSDSTDLAKFCNEMNGLYSGILLKEMRSIVQERDTFQARVKDLEQENSRLREDVYRHEKWENDQLLLANAQIEVKDDTLRDCWETIMGYKDCNGLAKDAVMHRAMDKAYEALTNSPATAKELIARMERGWRRR